MTDDPQGDQIANMRRRIAALEQRVTGHRDAVVTAVDEAAFTFAADVDGVGLVDGIPSTPQRLPEVGDTVRLLMEGATPIYQPGVQEVRVRSTTTSGEPYDLAELGKTYGTVDPATGEQTSGVTTGGDGSYQEMSVRSLIIGGTPFSEIIGDQATGLVAGGSRGSDTDPAQTAAGGGLTGFYETTIELEPGRMVEIKTSTIWARPTTTATTRIDVNLHYTCSISRGVDPPPVTTASPLWHRAGFSPAGLFGAPVTLQKFHRVDQYEHYRFLLSIGSSDGGAYIEMGSAVHNNAATGSLVQPDIAQIYAVDAGGQLWTNRAVLNGGSSGGSGAAPVKRYTYDYYPLWTRRFRGNGTVHSDGGDAYQGQTPYYVSNGNQATQVGDFRRSGTGPGIAADLAGATIESCYFGWTAKHWHSNTGGTGVLRYHNNVGPGSLSNFGGQWLVPGWKAGQGRWTNVGVSIGNGLRDGTVKGMQVGPGPSTSTEYYGYFYGHSAANKYRPVIRVTFTK